MKNQPKKLVRNKIVDNLSDDEWELVDNQSELNFLFALKVQEELQEIETANYQDIFEFADLIQTVYDFAYQNGFDKKAVDLALADKHFEKGSFGKIALKNMNPDNNQIYYK